MKALVNCSINYSYLCDVPAGTKDVEWVADCADPAYGELCKILDNFHLDYNGCLNSVVDSFTGEVLYGI